MAGPSARSILLVLSLLLLAPMNASGEHSPDHSGRCFASSAVSEELPLADQILIIDPGHGGEDVGAIANDLQEATIALDIADRLREMLLDSGARVCQTRTEDEYLSRSERADFANRNGGDLFVSVHLNSFDDPEPGYTLTLWQSGHDRRLAENVLGAMVDQLGQSPQGETTPVTGGRHSQFNSGMLRDASMPAIIAEPVFMSNPWEAEALRGDTWRQEQIAAALHDGIVAYVTEDRRFIVRAAVSGQSLVDAGARGWTSWLEASGVSTARQVAVGFHASAGLDQLSLIGIDLR